MEETKTTTFIDTIKGWARSFGLPRLIIAGFLLVLFIGIDLLFSPEDPAHALFQLFARKHYFMPAAGAPDPKIDSGPKHFPFQAAAGMRLFQFQRVA